MIEVSIREYTETPGPRYKKDGNSSAEGFIEFLEKYPDLNSEERLLIDFEDVALPLSWADEVARGLTEVYGTYWCNAKLRFSGEDDGGIESLRHSLIEYTLDELYALTGWEGNQDTKMEEDNG